MTSPTPGPPPTTNQALGKRAGNLKKLHDLALDTTLEQLTYNNFAACFPTIAQYKENNLRRIHKDFVAQLNLKCQVSVAPTGMSREVACSNPDKAIRRASRIFSKKRPSFRSLTSLITFWKKLAVERLQPKPKHKTRALRYSVPYRMFTMWI